MHTSQTVKRPRVIVIGGGFGGLFATQALRKTPVDVVLVDRSGFHLFQPLLYQVATGILSEGQVTRPLREVLSRQANARVVVGEVTHVDLTSRVVVADTPGGRVNLPFDNLIVAAGAGYSYFGHPGFAQHAPGLKSIEDALELRGRIFTSFEQAESATDPSDRSRHLTFAVVGGGPTGIEMAGQLRDLAARSLRGNFSTIDPRDARVVLLEAAPFLLPTYGRRLSAKTRESLEAVGVEVRVDARVTHVDETSVIYREGQAEHRLDATVKVWAAGVAAGTLASVLADQADVQRNAAGQLILEPDCTLPGHPDVFVVGDLMSSPGVPGVAQLAIQSGRFAARTIHRRLKGDLTSQTFTYRDKGSLATIARFRAVAKVGRFRFAGVSAWLFWIAVHLWTLMGFGRRLSVLLRWSFAFTVNRRPERIAPGVSHVHHANVAAGESRCLPQASRARSSA